MRFTRGSLMFALAGLVLALGCANSSIYGEQVGAPVRVETSVSAKTIALGESFDVSCKLLDAEDREVGGAATFGVIPDTFGLNGLAVVPDEAGDYTVACRSVDGDLVDETPEVVTVTPPSDPPPPTGPRVATRVTGDLPACWQTTVLCDVFDDEGEPVLDAETVVTAAPSVGVTVDDHRVEGNVPGAYAITCALADGSLVDEDPPTLTVTAGLPAQVVTHLDPEVIVPGGSAEVVCEVRDGCGNVVEGYATRIVADRGVTIDGTTISAEDEGSYTILCHLSEEAKPPTEDVPIELVVREPPPPVVRIELQAHPDRTVYPLNLAVEVVGVAYAADGRVVPEAEIVIEAPEGMTPDGDKYRFATEGAFTFHGWLAEDPSIDDELTLHCDAGPPFLEIWSPERGSTFDQIKIPVTGRVTDISGVAELTVNGVPIALAADGGFAQEWPAHYGLNVLWFQAKDTFGRSVRTSRAFYYSSGWIPMDPPDPDVARLLDSIYLYLGQEALDDGDHDPAHIDDIATVLELLLSSFDLQSLLGVGSGPIALFDNVFENIVYFPFQLLGIQFELSGDLSINVSIEEILVGGWRISALYRDGGIDFILGLGGVGSEDVGLGAVLGVTLAFNLQVGFYEPIGGTWIGVALDPPASVHTQTSAYLSGVFLEVGVDADMPPGGDLSVAVSELRITVEDIDINPLEDLILDFGGITLPLVGTIDLPEIPLTGLVAGINDLIGDNLIDPVLNWAVTGLSDLLAPIVSTAATFLVEQVVGVLALDLDLPLPALPGAQGAVTLHLSAAPSSVDMVPEGGTFGLGASLTADKVVDRDPLGSILRAGCSGSDPASLAFDATTPMQAAFLLDFANEALFSLWWGGGINLELDLGSLGGLGGVGNGVVALDFLLPPILTDCTTGGWVELQVGDLYLDLDGAALGFSGGLKAWASIRLGVEITADGNTLGVQIAGQPEIELEIVETSGMLATFESMIPSLIQDQLIPLLVDGVSDTLGAIPIPEIDLSGIVPSVPPGTVLRLGDLRAGAEHGYLLIGGALQ